jgi:hypothetical protein
VPPFPKKGGDGAPGGATVLDVHALLRRRGALQRAVRRSPSASGRAFRGRPNSGRPPSASSWQAARIGRRVEPQRRPSAWPARHARRRRSAPHEPAQPVRVPHGSRQLWVYYPIGILSRSVLWTTMAQKAKSNAPQAKEKTKTTNVDRHAVCAGDRVQDRDHHRRHRGYRRHAAPVVRL